ncbi:hypothetical protein Ac2012v2_006892 [Leucoagaricus gongylophorus]
MSSERLVFIDRDQNCVVLNTVPPASSIDNALLYARIALLQSAPHSPFGFTPLDAHQFVPYANTIPLQELMHVQSKPKLPSNQVALDSGEGNNEDANKSDQDKGARVQEKQASQARPRYLRLRRRQSQFQAVCE